MRLIATVLFTMAALAATPEADVLAQTQMQGGAPPPSVLRETHGDWEIRCLAENDCVMSQIARSDQNAADAVFTLIKPQGLTDETGSEVEALVEIVVPLGVYLPTGLGLQVDNGDPRAAPYERCFGQGCVVRTSLSDTLLNQFKRGATAHLVVFRAPGESVRVPISLIGFTAAFNAL